MTVAEAIEFTETEFEPVVINSSKFTRNVINDVAWFAQATPQPLWVLKIYEDGPRGYTQTTVHSSPEAARRHLRYMTEGGEVLVGGVKVRDSEPVFPNASHKLWILQPQLVEDTVPEGYEAMPITRHAVVIEAEQFRNNYLPGPDAEYGETEIDQLFEYADWPIERPRQEE